MDQLPPPAAHDEDIASYEVSEDGVTWRPYDAAADKALCLHRRILFAQMADEPPRAPTRMRQAP